MLACVCRPVTGSLPKHPVSTNPQNRPTSSVVTCEPRITGTATIVKKKVPGRPSPAELKAMALRQQQQIDSQHQLLAAKEQRLRFLKAQEVRGAAAAAEGERLRRLRERVEAQESKLRRLRALRGQVDLQKTYNVTLSNDLDSIRALFSEKEKELSLAVAKVEALTRQLEELRRDRRGPLNLIPGNGNNQQLPSPAARELEKLRRELMYRNQLSLQQDARLHLQREALQQRQAELRSVDQRILELQTRLQRKKASNLTLKNTQQNSPPLPLSQQQQQQQQQQQKQHHQQQQSHHNHQQQQKNTSSQQQQQQIQQQKLQLQHQQQQLNNQSQNLKSSLNNNNLLISNSSTSQSQQLQPHPPSSIPLSVRPSNSVYPSQRILSRGNVAAVEPYIHTPQKSAITPTSAAHLNTQLTKHSAATLNTNQQNQLIQDLTNLKLNLAHVNTNINVNHITFAESDETKLARQKLSNNVSKSTGLVKHQSQQQHSPQESSNELTKTNQESKLLPYKSSTTKNSQQISTNSNSSLSPKSSSNECDSEKAGEISETISKNQAQQLTVHSTPLNTVNKSVALAVSTLTTTTSTTVTTASPSTGITNRDDTNKPVIKPKALHQIPSGNLVVPPRKPISSVAPTSVTHTSAIPKIVAQSPKVNKVAPNIVSAPPTNSSDNSDKSLPRPALPPKPSKASPTIQSSTDNSNSTNMVISSSSTIVPPPTVVSVINKPQICEPQSTDLTSNSYFPSTNPDNLPIKAKPLTIRKQPLSEQPRLKSHTSGIKPIQYQSRRIEMPPAFLFPEIEKADLKDKSGTCTNQQQQISPQQQQQQQQQSMSSPTGTSCTDETDKSASSSTLNDEKSPDDVKRRLKHTTISSSNNGKVKLARRVSFDPLALLLDASLEGELELVKKTAMQVTNPSAANDEGITALHNAICAGHIEIVKFLVEFGCDVNAQDSDGWTPLHCAASCNNLAMVKFLVENGACLFAATLSDHETPAEKCEEDEEGFDGCSEYLYSIQEKLGILNNGEVYAVFSYDAQQPDELSFIVNDRLTILRKGDDAEREWWWAKNSSDIEGYVPRNLLGLYPRVPLQSSNYTD